MAALPTVGLSVFLGKCTGYVGVTVLGGKGIVVGKPVVSEVVGAIIACLLVDSGCVTIEWSVVCRLLVCWCLLVLG